MKSQTLCIQSQRAMLPDQQGSTLCSDDKEGWQGRYRISSEKLPNQRYPVRLSLIFLRPGCVYAVFSTLSTFTGCFLMAFSYMVLLVNIPSYGERTDHPGWARRTWIVNVSLLVQGHKLSGKAATWGQVPKPILWGTALYIMVTTKNCFLQARNSSGC
jgi:hypothetical protein